jgi:hypothetical protein
VSEIDRLYDDARRLDVHRRRVREEIQRTLDHVELLRIDERQLQAQYDVITRRLQELDAEIIPFPQREGRLAS